MVESLSVTPQQAEEKQRQPRNFAERIIAKTQKFFEGVDLAKNGEYQTQNGLVQVSVVDGRAIASVNSLPVAEISILDEGVAFIIKTLYGHRHVTIDEAFNGDWGGYLKEEMVFAEAIKLPNGEASYLMGINCGRYKQLTLEDEWKIKDMLGIAAPTIHWPSYRDGKPE